MTSDPVASPPTPAPRGIEPSSGKPLSGCSKLLLGCGVVVVLLGLVAGGLALLGYLRLVAPPEPVEPSHVVTAETQGWLRLAALRDDPGIQQLLVEILAESQRLQHEETQRMLESEEAGVPAWMRPWLGGSPASFRAKDLEWWMPRAGTFSWLPDPDCIPAEDCSPAVVGALEVGAGARVLGFAVEILGKMSDEDLQLLGDRAALPVGDDGSAVFRSGSLLFASRSPDLEALMDRLALGEDPPARRAPGALAASEMAELGRGEWDLYGYLDNRQGLFDSAFVGLLESLPATLDEEPYDPASLAAGVRELRFRLDVVTAEEARVELVLEVASPEQVATWRRLLERWRQQVTQAYEPLAIAADARADGSRLEVGWELRQVSTAVRQEMRRLHEASRAEGEPDDGAAAEPHPRQEEVEP